LLTRLQIQNFALISELTLDFKDGLTVVTGETGSGKSILLGALGLALGARSNSLNVRHGADICIVEATFFSPIVNRILEDFNLEFGSNKDTIIIRREVRSSGKSRSFINDSLVSAGTLREIGNKLVDLHGQDETRALMDRVTRLELLDDFGGHLNVRDSYRAAFSSWRTEVDRLNDLESEAKNPQSDRDYLIFQLEELSELGLHSLNQLELEEEYSRLKHATELAAGLYSTFEILDSNPEGRDAIKAIELAIKELEEIESYSKDAFDLLDRLKSVHIEIRDIALESSNLSESINHDPSKLDIVQAKMEALSTALHKHNVPNAKALVLVEQEINRRIEKCDGIEEALKIARTTVNLKFEELSQVGKELMNARIKSGKELLKLVHIQLSPLKLPHVEMSWFFTKLITPDLVGIEEVELLFSANPGSPPQPMSQIASGGERSRVMLAFKASLAKRTAVPTIVLDEIDTGVSGDVATRMASTMLEMSSGQQVFSVTHLAQVAACGHYHLEVCKKTTNSEAITQAVYLNATDRNEAIASMLSGKQVSDEARAAAKVLLTS
jgi:DNA repair protein RecN (Recombination protein N)